MLAYHVRLHVYELHARAVQSHGGRVGVELLEEAVAFGADADAGGLVGSDGGWIALEDADGMAVGFEQDAVEEASQGAAYLQEQSVDPHDQGSWIAEGLLGWA